MKAAEIEDEVEASHFNDSHSVGITSHETPNSGVRWIPPKPQSTNMQWHKSRIHRRPWQWQAAFLVL